MEEARKVTGSFVIAQKAVLGEKGKACGFCGFTSNSNETYPTDGNLREVSVDRLKPVCPHCNAYLHVSSEVHTSDLQSLMRISYAVFCLKKKTNNQISELHTFNHHSDNSISFQTIYTHT